ncbi:transposase [Streptomyces blastmyceticus]|uniref:Transposase IS701-like DDE domain-containing protein n=1 Tax=Streptomyces blastmyceticus TaxID=68180 RepID=A0ABP3HBH2_9ACTN
MQDNSLGIDWHVWPLFVPPAWDDRGDPRRAHCRKPEEAGRVAKEKPALEILHELGQWGPTRRPVVADDGYGQSVAFHHALRERGLDHVVMIRGDEIAQEADAVQFQPACSGLGPADAVPLRTPAPAISGTRRA